MQGIPHDIVGHGAYFISGDYLKSVRDFALSKGINPALLVADSGIALSDLLHPPPRIGYLSMHTIGSNLVAQLDNPLVACIEYAQHMANNYHGLLGIAAMEAMTLEDAGTLLVQFLSIRSNAMQMQLVNEHGVMKMRLIPIAGPQDNAKVRLFFELALLLNLEQLGREFLSEQIIEDKVQLNVPMPKPDDFPHALIRDRIDIHFDQPCFELCIPEKWAKMPVSTANLDVVREARSILESELLKLSPRDIAAVVRLIVRESDGVMPTLHAVAQGLHMSPSTLQRRLRQLGVSFKTIRNDELKQRAVSLLAESNLPIEAISEKLGFDNPSNFTKAFKSWWGVAPKKYRLGSGCK